MDLPVAQLRVCNSLADGPRTICGLAKELATTASAATQIADRLESAGLVERVPGIHDRRVKNLRLTCRGASLLRLRNERRGRRAAQVLSKLSPATRRNVLSALRALLEASVGHHLTSLAKARAQRRTRKRARS
jgi:DNA-binding MarR family transcriptional regulator